MTNRQLSSDKAIRQKFYEKRKFRERTFLGGISLKARAFLFIFLSISVMLPAGFAHLYASKQLKEANRKFSESLSFSIFVNTIEKNIWQIKAKSGELSKKLVNDQYSNSDAGKADVIEHIALTNRLGLDLDLLYKHRDALIVNEQVSTLREAVAQYIEQYRKLTTKVAEPTPDLTSMEAKLRQSIRYINKNLNNLNVLSLNETMADIRAVTTEFIESGAGRDLATIESAEKEFVRLLETVPISSENKKTLMAGVIDYQSSIRAYAKIRLVRDNKSNRIDEIISYMLPNINKITKFAGNNLTQHKKQNQNAHIQFHTVSIIGVTSALSLIILFGVFILRSISNPITAAANSAKKLISGDLKIEVPGIGNDDETGDIARALVEAGNRFGESNEKSSFLEKAKAEAERGRAASAEADWLRKDLESMKAEADKGKKAITEVAFLRKIVDATADNISEKQISLDKTAEDIVKNNPQPNLIPNLSNNNSLDKISSISRQVARSSETVTAAADEAERTGTLIRNLSDASDKLSSMETLITVIAEQADMLVINLPEQENETNLVVLNGIPERVDDVTRRFDMIRSTASQATWAVRDIGSMIREARETALDIARLSSAEALEVTTDLLQQSENLRGMLDNLVNKMQDQVAIEPVSDVKENDEDIK